MAFSELLAPSAGLFAPKSSVEIRLGRPPALRCSRVRTGKVGASNPPTPGPCHIAALSARGGTRLTSLAGLGGLTALAELDVSSCALAAGSLAQLRGCVGLRDLRVSHVKDLCSLEGLPTQLTRLQAARCGLSSLLPLADCASLARLDVSRNSLTSLRGLCGCTNLEVGVVWVGRKAEVGGGVDGNEQLCIRLRPIACTLGCWWCLGGGDGRLAVGRAGGGERLGGVGSGGGVGKRALRNLADLHSRGVGAARAG